MANTHSVRLVGPLAPYADDVWRALIGLGYSPDSVRNILRAVAHLSRWSLARGVPLGHLHRTDLERFFAARRRAGYASFIRIRSLDAAFGPLESAGAIRWVKPKPAAPTAFERLFSDYATHLNAERGLATGTIRVYLDIGRRFLAAYRDARRLDLRRLKADDVTSFILMESRCYSICTTKYAVSALRSLLRFLFWRGDMSYDLTTAVPAVAGWRLSGLPKAFERQQVTRLLRACDRRSQQGRRSFAVLLLMTRLGLRAGEVAALVLDDIDWTRGELVIRGKSRRHDLLPLPADVGAALARHLSDRARGTEERAVFLRRRAPRGALGVGGVKRLVNACLVRAGLSPTGAHRLRHTAATQMLRRGGSLDEIAQVLRHKSHATTAIYAKVDFAALRAVIRPWPRGAL